MSTTTSNRTARSAITPPSASVLEDITTFTQQNGRRPSPTAHTRDERRLGIWLDHRRRTQRRSKLEPSFAEAIESALPDWGHTAFPTAAARTTTQDVLAYHHEYGHWPKTTRGTQHERLGTWMQSRRREARLGTLDPAIEAALDSADPGWRGTGTPGRPGR